MKGFFNRILIIDLSKRTYEVENISEEIYRMFLGGKGLGAYLAHARNDPGVDPLSPQNNFIISTGPVSDTLVWGSSRYGVFTKSPLTGFFSHSYSGGRAAEPISRAGYDAICIKGVSPEPVYLEISDEAVRFHDATWIWGTSAYDAEDFVLKETGKKGAGALVIGPAGENLVRFAAVINSHWRCAGRTGAGAVLGSKKVKALVFHGSTKRVTADPNGLRRFRDEWLARSKDLPATGFFRNFGTPGLTSIINTVGAFPTRYWHEGSFEGWEGITAETLHSQCEVKPHACNRCLLACGRMTKVVHGRHKGLVLEGPEYETIYAFGGLCLIKDIKEIIYLNDICDRLGMDTITAGNLAAFTIEASLAGRIEEELAYGDVDGVASLLRNISRREGIGEILADGITRAAREWGMEDSAVHVKGMEPAGYDPRIFKGMGLAYATSDRGACHLRSTFFRAELSGMIPPDKIEGKAELFVDFEDRLTLHDTMIVCRFYRDLYLWDELCDIVRMTTGMDVGKEDLRKIAARIQNTTRIFNIREGLTKKDDTLPQRFFREGIGAGKSVIREDELERLISDYYMLRGWDSDGVPPERV